MEPNDKLLTEELIRKIKTQQKKTSGVKRLPRRKYVPRNPNLPKNFIPQPTSHELEEGEIPVQNPLNSLMQKFSTEPVSNPEVQIKKINTPPNVKQEEEITVTPDVQNFLTEPETPSSQRHADNQILLKKVRALIFPCPLCPMEATQGHIRFHLHSVHGALLRDFEAIHTCLICCQGIKSKDVLAHSLSHDFDMAHDCNHCDDRFFYKIRLDQHLEKVHQTFSCELCEMTFYSKKEWKQHATDKVHKMKKFAQEELHKRGINLC
ncbi:uncharacterized protein LOC134834974 [Culicoides brevitarsis]|uniref:uncharacterized protein LOC134834974 n=1 Tax=Culicoides brevitarsis TaxID=469753 RepID=UPI00307B8BBD